MFKRHGLRGPIEYRGPSGKPIRNRNAIQVQIRTWNVGCSQV